MSFTSKSQTEILVAGYQDKMFVIDVNKGEITKEVLSTRVLSCWDSACPRDNLCTNLY